MPQALVDKIAGRRDLQPGLRHRRVPQLGAPRHGAAHGGQPGRVDAAAFEKETLARIGAPRQVVMRHRLPQFGHLFAGDAYSAGYYSYLWSEVMDADTRAAFREAGDVFAPAVAAKLRKHILADGNTVDRGEAYRAFRGRDPDVKALLEKRGFPTK
jgi:peptidyl-dipeptidase Dcp